jgi:hypothetical protein
MVAKSRTSGSLKAPPLPSLTLGWVSVSGAMTLSTYAGANSVELPILAELIVIFEVLATSEGRFEENTPWADRILFLNMVNMFVERYKVVAVKKSKSKRDNRESLITGEL